MVATESQFQELFGSILDGATAAMPRCACVACNSCTCACSCRNCPENEGVGWPE